MHGLLKVGTMIHLMFRDVYLQICRSIPKSPPMEGNVRAFWKRLMQTTNKGRKIPGHCNDRAGA